MSLAGVGRLKNLTGTSHGSVPIGFMSNWTRFCLGPIIVASLTNGSPNRKCQAVKQHLNDHVGAELETSRVYSWRILRGGAFGSSGDVKTWLE